MQHTESQFFFLKDEFPELFELAHKAELESLSMPKLAAVLARMTLEGMVNVVLRLDGQVGQRFTEKPSLAEALSHPAFKACLDKVAVHADVLRIVGNKATHEVHKELARADASQVMPNLFQVCFWFARRYGSNPPPDGLSFERARLPKGDGASAKQQAAELAALKERIEAEAKARTEAEQRLSEDADKWAALQAELDALRQEKAALIARNSARPDTHDYNEADTRTFYIDLLIREAGWQLDPSKDCEVVLEGLPTPSKKGRADYVLWGDNGKPLAVIEAKRAFKDVHAAKQQVKHYADALEKQYHQRPLMFYTNGYAIWFWDDTHYPERKVAGFYKREELERLILRRELAKPLESVPINETIAGRYYQKRAIQNVGQRFAQKQRRALLVMATGTGKTRTVVALIDQMMRANQVYRVLFLADRTSLVNQAARVFKELIPTAPLSNLLQRHNPESNDIRSSRIVLSTYQTMMGKIDSLDGGAREFGPGHFDLVIVDEAHRSVYSKFGAIFDYFDALLLGLTATPRSEVDRQTYKVFGHEDSQPTDYYSLGQAVKDAFLVPPIKRRMSTRFRREGIQYDKLSEAEKEQWNQIEWGPGRENKDFVESKELEVFIFNANTTDKILAAVMQNGIKVEGGDRLGKTIIFARSQKHAQHIIDRFNVNYPGYKGTFAARIDHSVKQAQSLLDDFSKANSEPHIAVSVDMLDTGVDVPEVVNLVFWRPVYSKVKYWQMIGRGTRLCPNLFGEGAHKTEFAVFDVCQNIEYFGEDYVERPTPIAKPLSERIFVGKVDLLQALVSEQKQASPLYAETLAFLRAQVDSISSDNFTVRPHLKTLERFRSDEVWAKLNAEDLNVLREPLASLPMAPSKDSYEARQFDLFILRGQVALLGKRSLVRTFNELTKIAEILESKSNIALVAIALPLIREIQSKDFWQYVTVEALEEVRLQLRHLVVYADTKQGPHYITVDFTDEVEANYDEEIREFFELPDVLDVETFKKRARAFLEGHKNHITLKKLTRFVPLTPQDLHELERMLLTHGVANEDILEEIKEGQDFGLFLRSLVDLDRGAAVEAFNEFLVGKRFNADQIEFIDMIIDALTENGRVEPGAFYESPFIDIDERGLSMFGPANAQQIIAIVKRLNTVVQSDELQSA